jgi:hypothetical protein
VAERHFSPSEVEALIPVLTDVMARVMEAHRGATEARERLQAEQRRIAMAGGGIPLAGQWRADTETYERLARVVQGGLAEIAELGGVTKDLGLGLVDFIHLRDGREVNLCWKYPERHIRWWHGLDEGYAARKPL